jgi:Fur family zinc uptake transcriptional regulator
MSLIKSAINILKSLAIEVTPLREEILTILAQSSVPLSAYQILDQLKLLRTNAKPMTVYRTLATFEKANLIHKIEKDSTYVLCCHPSENNNCQIIFCSSCGEYKELHDKKIQEHIRQVINSSGFTTDHQSIQISALCKNCS